ncbi:leucine-rich repeat domain-containing protein [Algoriphagus yeomjeoni]|uniref:leucine-rich repeat domain-containing protein n=1 Tax=Algoriphagus yeomjeoni TaxID=291403 RepID=UPI003CE58F0A
MIRENTRQSDFLATVILNFKRRKLTFLLIAFFLSVVDCLPQQTQKVENRANSEKNDLDKSLDLLLESNLENRFDELNSIHSKQPEKSSSKGAMMMSNPLPSQAEYDALMDLYQSTGGANWNYNSGWSTANPNVVQYVGNWHGVITDANGHVTYLLLSDNNLVGTVPSSIENLSNLYWLDFRSNSLSGDLEDWLGVFPYLTVLHLANNSFTGPIPLDLGLNTNLTDVYFNRNQLSGSIPTNIGNLSSLVWLVLYDNDLTGSIPSQIGNLVNLQYLYLYRNNLSGPIPSTIGNMQALKFLGLHTNSFSGQLPSTIGSLSNLTTMLLQYNQFSGPLPSQMGNMSSLQEIRLYNNSFSGSIPGTIGSLTNVHSFYAHENQLTGFIPYQLGSMSSLMNFRLNLNKLTGSIPSELGNLSNLQDLRLANNQLTGPIPSSLGNLVNVSSLTLNNNELTGSIPSSLCSLPNISQLELQSNLLKGVIPNCLYDKNISMFLLSYNNFNFENLAYAKTKVLDNFQYSPQKLDFVDTVYVQPNASLNLTVDDGNYQGAQSSYRWKKNGTWLHSASPGNKTISVNCSTSSCEGLYYLEITNPDYPGSLLFGDLYYVKIGEDLLQTICMVEEEEPISGSNYEWEGLAHYDWPRLPYKIQYQ